MLKCKIIFKGVEYTHQEFKEYVLANGMGSLLPDSPSKLAMDIVSKFDIENAEESLDELWARLSMEKRGITPNKLLTKTEVARELNPKGQLTDYSVQEEIRYNTYAGIDLTGISANFGKTMGYAIDASPISSVLDTTSGETLETGTQEFLSLLKENGVYSAEALVEKSNRYKVVSRKPIKLQPKYAFKVDNVEVNTLQRNTIKELSHKGKETNVFETIDTVINLAIDNVKEGKLSVLGITSVNANTYLTMLGMGVPLNIVSRIFKTPLLMEANENSRWNAKILSENYISPLKEDILSAKQENLKEALVEFFGNEAKAQKTLERIEKGEDVYEIFSGESINTKVLDQIYIGKASPELKSISDMVTIGTVFKLLSVGEELFEYAQIFGALRSLPNKKWKVDSLIEKIEKHNSFRDEANTKTEVNEALQKDLLENFKEKDEKYIQLVAEKKTEEADKYAMSTVKEAIKGNNLNLFGSKSMAIRASFVNRVLKGSVSRTIEENNSVFENLAVLRIPNVFAAYKTLLQLKTILENSFAVYNPVVQTFVKNLLKEANIYTGTDELEKVDLVSKEFVKFLASNLTFEIENKPFTTDVPLSETFSTSNISLTGKEAWAQNFCRAVLKLADDPELQTNAFVRALEMPAPDASGLYKVMIIGDKVNDEEVLEEIRDSFLQLSKDRTEIFPGYTRADIAIDFFKYALMGEAMYYEKTGFALIFPAHWVVKYGVALDDRLDSVIPKGQAKTDLNLAIMKDRFMFQFLKNNPSLVSKNTRYKPELQSKTKTADKEQESYAGMDNVDGVDIYFDLKYKNKYHPNAAKFLRRYDDSVYALIDTPGSEYTYYVKVTEPTSNRYYNFEPSEMDLSIDISKLTSGKHPLVNANAIINNTLTTDYKTHVFEKDQVIAAFAKSSTSGKNIFFYKVNSVQKLPEKIKYNLSFVSQETITMTNKAVELKNFMGRFINESLGTTISVDSLKEYRDIQFKNKRARLLTNELGKEESTAMILPIYELPPDMSPENQDMIANQILYRIEKLDSDLNYYVDSKILNPLNGYPVLRNKIAKALRDKIGFLEAFKEREDSQEEFKGALMLGLKEAELLAWSFKNNTVISAVEGQLHTHTAPIKGEMRNRNIQPGDLVGAGNGVYFFVDSISNNNLNLIEFRGEVFNAIQTSNLSREEFLKIYESVIKC